MPRSLRSKNIPITQPSADFIPSVPPCSLCSLLLYLPYTKAQHSGCTHLMSWLHVGSISSTQQPQEVLWLTVLILWNWGQRVSDLFKATWPVWNTDEPWGAYGVHVMANPKVSWSEGRGMDMLGSSWWCPHVRVPVQGLVVQCSHICLVRDLQITLLVRAEYAMK